MNDNDTKEWPIERFLQWVAEIVRKDDRGTLAELRRGLSETTQDQAWEHLIPYCADFEDADHRAVWCAVGGLAATLVPDCLAATEPWSNLGTTMHALAKGAGDGDEAKSLKTFEPKFRRALSCGDVRTLCEMAVGICRTASIKGVPVNLKALFWDLWNWGDSEKRETTRLRWAKQYFGTFERRPKESAPAPKGDDA